MCKFKSGIVLKKAGVKGGFQLLMSPWTESHEDLIAMHNLRDVRDNMARVEFSPQSMETADKPETYRLTIDEARRPEWFSEDMERQVTERMAAYIKSIIVTGDVCLLIGGQFVLAGGAKVETAKACVITAMLGTSQVGEMWETSKVGVMRGTSKVGVMRETSKVGEMRDTSKVGVMRETSQVGVMWDTSQVGEMRDTSQVGVMWETSQVGVMRETSQVGVMWDTSQVGVMWETSQVLRDGRK